MPMPSTTCDACGRPIDGVAYACRPCGDKAGTQLRTTADAVPAARDVVHGFSRHGPAVHGSGGSRVPVNLTAGARLDAVQNAITTLARHVSETRGRTIPDRAYGPTCATIWPACPHDSCAAIRAGDDPLATAASWLAGHTDWLRHRREAPEAFAIIAAAERVVVAISIPPGERRWLGQCGADLDDGGECDAELYAKPGATAATCRTCGTRHDARDRRAHLDQVARGYAYTASEIASAYGIRANTISVWAHRGRIVAIGEVGGHPVYPLGQVLDLAAVEAARRATLAARKARRAEDAAARHDDGTLTGGEAA
jgi:hypothetical protein